MVRAVAHVGVVQHVPYIIASHKLRYKVSENVISGRELNIYAYREAVQTVVALPVGYARVPRLDVERSKLRYLAVALDE